MTILLDKYSRQVLSENQAVEMLYADPALDVTNLCLMITEKNQCAETESVLKKQTKLPETKAKTGTI